MATSTKFDNVLNFRDVATTTNRLSNSNTLKPGLFYRSARPETATTRDRDLLRTHYHIATILDLRSKTEHINAARNHSNNAAIPPAVPEAPEQQPSSTNLEPLKIPGISYKDISLNGPGFERALLWQLRWSSLSRLIGLMALGYRNEAISILGREVMQPRGLVGLGIDTLDSSQREIKQIFDILADKSAYPVLVHCTQGKDRTGLVVLLVSLLCGVDKEAMETDYHMSEAELEPERESRLKEIEQVGLNESFAGCPAGFVQAIVHHLDERYGGVTGYLAKAGVKKETQEKVKSILMQQTASTR